MAKRLKTTWPLEPHTFKKHELLKEYVKAWLPIVGSFSEKVLYIDGFAGPGSYSQGEDGSPLVVLKAARDHQHAKYAEFHCLFVENNASRFTHLKKALLELQPTLPPSIKATAVHGRFDNHLASSSLLLQQARKERWPTLAFVDPFGFSQTPFSSIQQVLSVDHSEVFVNFMFEEVNRFLSLPEQADSYDKLFGTADWRPVMQMKSPAERRSAIRNLYTRQLRKATHFVNSFEMRNSSNSTDYILFFATGHVRGYEKMKEAMWKVDTSGSNAFSDFSERRGQMSLFQNVKEQPELKAALLTRFSGQSAEIGEIEAWVIAETRFLKRHVRESALNPLEQEGLLSIQNPKQRRIVGQFPPGSVLNFKSLNHGQ